MNQRTAMSERIRNNIYKRYYSFKFKPLIIREKTSDIEVFKQIFIDKDYGFPVNIDPKLIIDGGANAGYASLFFADRFPKAEIIAIEPEDSNFEVLVKNTARYKQIKPIKAGLWHKKVNLKIVDKNVDKWGFRTEESDCHNTDVPAMTIDEILKQSKHNEIDILKLDVEGAEKEIFSYNYDSWLGKVNILIIELHDKMKPGCGEAFYSAIKKYNFEKALSGENIILVKQSY